MANIPLAATQEIRAATTRPEENNFSNLESLLGF